MNVNTQNLVERFFSDLLCSGHQQVEVILSEDIRVRSTLGGEARGREAFWEDFFQAYRGPFGGFSHEIIECVSSYEGAAARVRFSGYHRRDVLGIPPLPDQDVAWTASAFFQIEDDQITDVWIQDDVDALRASLRGEAAPHQVTVYWSLQSPYCWFLNERMQQLAVRPDVEVTVKPVRPGVIRMPDAYRDRSDLELAYFEADTVRTAEFLDVSYAPANPSPVAFTEGLWVAAPEQPLIQKLYQLFAAAAADGKALDFVDIVMRLIWSGETKGWDKELDEAIAHLDLIPMDPTEMVEANEAEMYEAGHWGVPLSVYRGEAFYGQDRWDQLLWRIEDNA